MELSRQEYWSGLPFPFLGGLPNLGIKSVSLALQADSLALCYLGSPVVLEGEPFQEILAQPSLGSSQNCEVWSGGHPSS